MAYSGAWRSARTQRLDGSKYTDPPSKLGVPEQAALHMESGPDVGGSRPPWASVPAVGVPDFLTDPGAEYEPSRAVGLVLDVEPTDNHQDGHVGSGHQTREQARAQGHRARTDDRGAAARQTFRQVRERASDETRTTEMYVVAPISAGSRVAALRGDNSLPENNPDGYRVGQRVRRYQDRKIPGGGLRRHSVHPLRVNTAAAPHVSPEPGANGNRYASPFSLNISSRTRTMQAPMTRRVPRTWDENVITDGSGEGTPTYQVWGL